MKKLFCAALACLPLLSAPAYAQGTSAGCLAVNALGSQSITSGVPVTFGPFTGFDEGFADQPSDGDTIRLGIGARDMIVSVEYIGSGGTTTGTMTTSRTFSNLIIGGSSNHPEAGSLSIRLTMTGGTSASPRVFIQCLGTPNPGQPPATTPTTPTTDPTTDPTTPTTDPTPPTTDPATPTTPPTTPTPPTAPTVPSDEQALRGAFTVVQAEDNAKLGTSTTDLPSKLTTPAPDIARDPEKVLDELSAEITRATDAALADTVQEFETRVLLDLRAEGLTEEQIDAVLKEFGGIAALERIADAYDRLTKPDVARPTTIQLEDDDSFDENSVAGLLFENGGIAPIVRRFDRISQQVTLSSAEESAVIAAIVENSFDLARTPTGPLALAAKTAHFINLSDLSLEEKLQELDKAIKLLDGVLSPSQISRWNGRLSAAGTNIDFDLTEGDSVLRADTANNTLSFALSGKDIGVDIGENTSLWVQGKLSFMLGNAQGTEGTAYNLRVGVTHKLSSRAEVGAFAGGFMSDHTVRSSGAETDTEAYQLGVYGNYKLTPGLTFGASAHFEDGTTETNDAGVTGSYGYETLGATLSLSGQAEWQDWSLLPSVSYGYSKRDTEGYTNSAAVAVRGTEVTTNSLTAAISASRSQEVDSARLDRIDTRLSAAATYFDRSHSVLTGINQDQAGASLGAGLTLHMDSGALVTLDANLSGIGQDTPTLGLSGRYSLSF